MSLSCCWQQASSLAAAPVPPEPLIFLRRKPWTLHQVGAGAAADFRYYLSHGECHLRNDNGESRSCGKKHNVELLVQAPDEANLEQQIRIMEMMIKRGVDGIAIAPADSLALTSVINKAVARGFPWFVLSRIRLPAAEKPSSGLIIEQPALLLDRLWNACLAEKG